MNQAREIEVKYRVVDLAELETALRARDLTFSPPLRQDDQAYLPQCSRQRVERREQRGHERPLLLSLACAAVARGHVHAEHGEAGLAEAVEQVGLPAPALVILADVATAAIQCGRHERGAQLGHEALDQTLAREVSLGKQRLRSLHLMIQDKRDVAVLAELDDRLLAHVA